MGFIQVSSSGWSSGRFSAREWTRYAVASWQALHVCTFSTLEAIKRRLPREQGAGSGVLESKASIKWQIAGRDGDGEREAAHWDWPSANEPTKCKVEFFLLSPSTGCVCVLGVVYSTFLFIMSSPRHCLTFHLLRASWWRYWCWCWCRCCTQTVLPFLSLICC